MPLFSSTLLFDKAINFTEQVRINRTRSTPQAYQGVIVFDREARMTLALVTYQPALERIFPDNA